MKKVNIPCLFVIVLVFISMRLIAQDISDLKTKSPFERAQFQTGLMKSELKLDSQQVIKAQFINVKYAYEMEPLLKSNASKFKRLMSGMSIQKSKDAELKQVFTTAQFKQYLKLESKLIDALRAKGMK